MCSWHRSIGHSVSGPKIILNNFKLSAICLLVVIFLVEMLVCENEFDPRTNTLILNSNIQNSQRIWNSDSLPQIHSPKLKLTVQKGDTVLLPCRVHNLGENQILWRKGTNVLAGSNVTTYSDDRIRLLQDFTLEMSKVTLVDEGLFECLITSWPPLSLVHQVSVFDPPTINLIPAGGSIIVCEGETAKMACIPSGNPLPKINWSKRNGTIPLHRSSLNQSRLVLDKVSRQHTGLYVCTADNGVGRPSIGAVFVRVLHAPDLEIPKRRVYGGLREKSKLTCICFADPKPDVIWSTGQSPIHLSDRVQTKIDGSEYSLIFNAVRDYDFNVYTCSFNNSIGRDSRHIEFTGVPQAPVVSRWDSVPEPGTLDLLAVTLFWAVESLNPLIDFRLMFRVTPLKYSSNNMYNQTNKNSILSISTPETTNTLDLQSVQEERTQSVWTELTIPADPSSGSFIHSKAFTIRGLSNNTIYEVALKARNNFGWSFLSNVSYFSTFPYSLKKSKEIEEWLTRLSGSSTSFQDHRQQRRRQKQNGGFGIGELDTTTSGGGVSKSIMGSAIKAIIFVILAIKISF